MVAIGQRFTALEDFYAEETSSHYVAGLGYTADNERLAALVARWVDEGKVKLGGGAAIMQGKE